MMGSGKKDGCDELPLRRRTRKIENERFGHKPEILETLSPDALRRLFHELRASRDKYFDMYDRAPVGYYLLDNHGLIREANLTFAAMLGMTKEALLNQPLSRFVCREDQDICCRHQQQLFESGAPAASCELRLIKKDGALFWTRLMANSTQRIGEETLVRAIAGDINERKLAEEAQRRSAEMQAVLRKIAEAAVVSSLDDLYRLVHQLMRQVLPANFLLITLLDETAGEIVVAFRSDTANVLPERRRIAKGVTEYVMRMGRAVHLRAEDMARLRLTGEYTLKKLQKVKVHDYLGVPLTDSQGKSFGVISLVLMDKTQTFRPEDVEVLSIIGAQLSLAIERKQAETALKSSEARYRALIEQSFEALALVDIETQELVEVNRRFTELLGYSLPGDAPLYVYDLVVDSRKNLDIHFHSTLRQQHFFPILERVVRHKNGTKVHVERAGSVINLGGRDHYLVSMRDMTAERRLQAELIRDVEVARQIQRGLLPELPESPLVTVRTLYYPLHFLSGDAFHMEWITEGKVLRGFLIDVSGHGLSTALQTASVSVLLRETTVARIPLFEQLQLLNKRVAKYFTDEAYAAIIGFELDFPARELRYVGAGITRFFANGKTIETPGMFVGAWDSAQFMAGSLPMMPGDTFHFLTDGFTDWMAHSDNSSFWSPDGRKFEADVAAMQQIAEKGKLRDDATGICLQIKGPL